MPRILSKLILHCAEQRRPDLAWRNQLITWHPAICYVLACTIIVTINSTRTATEFVVVAVLEVYVTVGLATARADYLSARTQVRARYYFFFALSLCFSWDVDYGRWAYACSTLPVLVRSFCVPSSCYYIIVQLN